MQRDNVRDILAALLLAAAIVSLVWPAQVTPWMSASWTASWAASGATPAAVPVVGDDSPVRVVR